MVDCPRLTIANDDKLRSRGLRLLEDALVYGPGGRPAKHVAGAHNLLDQGQAAPPKGEATGDAAVGEEQRVRADCTGRESGI